MGNEQLGAILCFCRSLLNHPVGDCPAEATHQPVHAGVRVPVCGACLAGHERAALDTGRELIERARVEFRVTCDASQALGELNKLDLRWAVLQCDRAFRKSFRRAGEWIAWCRQERQMGKWAGKGIRWLMVNENETLLRWFPGERMY